MKRSLKTLLDEFEVEIPFLQRNYIHGANTPRAEEIRNHFLNEFINSMTPEGRRFDLNFIFGTRKDNKIIPVDGQQRLTTLWLLAAYIANHRNTNSHDVNCKTLPWKLERFNYAGRPLAAFALKLIAHGATSEQLREAGLCSDITVSSMAQTLETIANDERLKNYTFEQLVSGLNNVEFEFEQIKQDADYTYIKMNARGKTLTQWENFKGKFSELLKANDNSACNSWNCDIEKATNKYIALQKEDLPLQEILPDDSFISLVARILLYELCKSQNNDNTDEFPNLVLLTKHIFNGKAPMPFVPFEEFQKIKDRIKDEFIVVAYRITRFILQVVGDEKFATNYYPYWEFDKRKTLWETILKPDNERERDFGLILYEYTNYNKFLGQKISDGDFSSAVRLITNIVENDASNDRVKHCIHFFDNGASLYGLNHLDPGDAWQIAEEIQKGFIYSYAQSCKKKMQDLESMLHGRVRIAILDLSKNIKDVFSNCFDVTKINHRIDKTLSILKDWFESQDNNERKRFYFERIIPNLDWKLQDDIVFDFEPAGLLNIFRTRNDACLQHTLIDGNQSIEHSSQGSWDRDWRDILKTETMQSIVESRNKIRWHRNSGRYYLYTTSIITHAYPISDYRIDVLFDQAFAYSVGDIRWHNTESAVNLKDVLRMNDAATTSFRMGNNLQCYFYKDEIHVRAYDDRQGKILKDQTCSYDDFKDNIPSFLQYICSLKRDVFLSVTFSLREDYLNNKHYFLDTSQFKY